MKEQIKPRRVMECRNRKTRLLKSFPPPCCNYQWISGPPEQYNLPPLLPHGKKVFVSLFPQPVYVPHPINKWPARPLSRSLFPGYKSVLRIPVQRRFSLELARCSNSVSHSHKLYFPFILSHVWKFFSNLPLDHDIELPWGSLKGVAAVWYLLDCRYFSPSWVSLGFTSSHWRAAVADNCDILVYWYGRKYFISHNLCWKILCVPIQNS